MREICTYVDIDAGASLVWQILTDFSVYRSWNPTLRGVLGSLQAGNTIVTTERQPGAGRGDTTEARQTVKHVREPRELYWLGTFRLAWMYATERRFRIETLAKGGVRFHQNQRFRGFLVPFMWAGLRRDVTPGFQAMNEALKSRAERAEADFVATRPPRAA